MLQLPSRCRHPRRRVTSIPEAPGSIREAAAYWVPRLRGGRRPCAWGRRRRPTTSPTQPFRLARQFDGLDLLELDRALTHQVVEVGIGRSGDFRAIEIDLERAAMVLLGPGRGIADAFHAGGYPILLLVEALGDVLAGGAAVLGGPVERFLQIQRAANGRDVMHGAVDLPGRVRHF